MPEVLCIICGKLHVFGEKCPETEVPLPKPKDPPNEE